MPRSTPASSNPDRRKFSRLAQAPAHPIPERVIRLDGFVTRGNETTVRAPHAAPRNQPRIAVAEKFPLRLTNVAPNRKKTGGGARVIRM
jgi:hypothetical protein